MSVACETATRNPVSGADPLRRSATVLRLPVPRTPEPAAPRLHRPAPPARLIRPARPAGVRLTLRGRRLVTAVVAAAVLVTLVLGGRAAAHALGGSQLPASAPHAVVVQPGDTLWTIARRVAPSGDARAVVAELRSTNHLPGATVHPGQRLWVRPSR